jgi:hypothetical protein
MIMLGLFNYAFTEDHVVFYDCTLLDNICHFEAGGSVDCVELDLENNLLTLYRFTKNPRVEGYEYTEREIIGKFSLNITVIVNEVEA